MPYGIGFPSDQVLCDCLPEREIILTGQSNTVNSEYRGIRQA